MIDEDKGKEDDSRADPVRNARILCVKNHLANKRERGMVKLRPTVTTKGDVSNIAYAQQMSEMKEVAEFICKDILALAPISTVLMSRTLPAL